MAEITRILAANICRQFFFVIIATASNVQLICYSQRVNATSQFNDMVVEDVQNGRTIGWLQWQNIAGFMYMEEEVAEKDD